MLNAFGTTAMMLNIANQKHVHRRRAPPLVSRPSQQLQAVLKAGTLLLFAGHGLSGVVIHRR